MQEIKDSAEINPAELLAVAKNDYVEIYLQQSNLTGNLVGCTFNLSIRL